MVVDTSRQPYATTKTKKEPTMIFIEFLAVGIIGGGLLALLGEMCR